jgi:hypothetical protein
MPGWFGRIVAGVAAGLAGGAVFGILLQLTGTIPVVARLVDQESPAIGWAVHMTIAVFVGITYTLIFGIFSEGLLISAVLGSFYGIIWWVLGGLALMPLRLGLGLFVFDATAWQSLAGHVAYGLVLGGVYAVMVQLLAGRRERARNRRAPAHRRDAATPFQPLAPREDAAVRFPPLAPREDAAVLFPPLAPREDAAVLFPPAFPPPAPGLRPGVAPLSPAARALRQRGRPSQHP